VVSNELKIDFHLLIIYLSNRCWSREIEEGTIDGQDLAIHARTSQTIEAFTRYSYNPILNLFSDNLSSSRSSNLEL